MTIVSKPATKAYRDNYDATFGKAPTLPKSFDELRPVCKWRKDIGGAFMCRFHAFSEVCEEPCPVLSGASRRRWPF